MISFEALIVAVVAASIPVAWLFICRWFMIKDVAETELLDQLEADELTDAQKVALESELRDSKEAGHPVGQLSHA